MHRIEETFLRKVGTTHFSVCQGLFVLEKMMKEPTGHLREEQGR